MQNFSNEDKEIYNSRNNLLKQLKSQNYDVSDYENINMMEIGIMARAELLDMVLENKDENKKCYVKYFIGKSLRHIHINEYIEDLFVEQLILDKETDDLIIIVKDEPNDTLIRALKDIWEQNKYYIRVISRKRLQFNILEHNYVPEHIIISEEEKQQLFIEKNISSPKELPEISRFDPVALTIGIKPGQVCKIIRNSRTAIDSIYYRICIQ